MDGWMEIKRTENDIQKDICNTESMTDGHTDRRTCVFPMSVLQ